MFTCQKHPAQHIFHNWLMDFCWTVFILQSWAQEIRGVLDSTSHESPSSRVLGNTDAGWGAWGRGYGIHRTCKAWGKEVECRHAQGHMPGRREQVSNEAGRIWVSQWDNFLTVEAWAAEVVRGLTQGWRMD